MNAQTVKAAEQQMRRSAPEQHLSKRQKTGDEGIARYNYSSEESLQNGAQGFVVTCAFRREKSATKEVMQLLNKYLVLQHSEADTDQAAECTTKPATCDGQPSANESASPQPAVQLPANTPQHSLSLAKLATSGLLMLQLHSTVSSPEGTQQTDASDTKSQAVPVEILRHILQDLQAGRLASPEFCERIIPVQTTCSMTMAALTAAAQQIAALHAAQAVQAADNQLVKFAVAYKSRGSTKIKQATSAGKSQDAEPMKREELIAAVAKAVEDAVLAAQGKVKVDLQSPEVVIFVETLPLNTGSVFALSWLQHGMTCQSPKLSVKPLVASAKVSQPSAHGSHSQKHKASAQRAQQ